MYEFEHCWVKEYRDIDLFQRRRKLSCLKNLDLNDIRSPLKETAAYLTAKYQDRFLLKPCKLEQLVGDVFRSAGYRVRVTSTSNDGGIDIVVLDGAEDATVGVQVKRYKGKIKAEQIRAFAGALLVNNMTRGVYVTTSSYQPGARRHARYLRSIGYDIQLWDAHRLYDSLKLTSRPPYGSPEDPDTPFHDYWTGRSGLARYADSVRFRPDV